MASKTGAFWTLPTGSRKLPTTQSVGAEGPTPAVAQISAVWSHFRSDVSEKPAGFFFRTDDSVHVEISMQTRGPVQCKQAERDRSYPVALGGKNV